MVGCVFLGICPLHWDYSFLWYTVFFFFIILCSLWDLSSLLRDQTQALCSESVESELVCTCVLSCFTRVWLCDPMAVACQAPLTTGPPGKFPGIYFLMLLFYSPFYFCKIYNNDSIFTYNLSNLRPLPLFLFNLAKDLSILLIFWMNQLLVPLIFFIVFLFSILVNSVYLSLLFHFCFFLDLICSFLYPFLKV